MDIHRRQLQKIIAVYKRNKPNRQHTYLAPKVSFDNMIRDELMWVESVDTDTVTVFRTMTGKFYEITIDNVSRFKLISD